MTAFKQLVSRLWVRFGADLRFFAVAAGAFMAFQTAAFGMYYIPSESMLPTLAVGDRVVVNKFAYGYSRHSLPFSLGPDWPTADGRVFSRLPQRGDIVVFSHPKNGNVLIKRVIGLPSDEIALNDGLLIVNGVAAPTEAHNLVRYREHKAGVVTVEQLTERFGDAAPHQIYDRGVGFPGDDFGPVRVPEGALFVMGDNRDNSLDSRFGGDGVGLLPIDRLIGKAEFMPFSFHMCRREAGITCLHRRWGTAL